MLEKKQENRDKKILKNFRKFNSIDFLRFRTFLEFSKT